MRRVAWNLLWLRPGVVGGSEEYATRQLAALVEHASDRVHVTAHVLAPFAAAHPELAARVDLVTVPLDGANKPLRVGAETTWLASRTRRGFDLVHHVGGRIPLVASAPRVLTVHDLQPLEQPQNFSAAKRHFLARAIPRSVRRAAVVVTPSEQVRGRVIDRFGLDPARVCAIAAPVRAVDVDALPAADHPSVPDVLRPLLAGANPYVVYPAFTHPHKNHLVLLDAFARVRAAHPDAQLVLTLGAGGAEGAVQARLARADLAGAVVRVGRLERDVLDALVARAAALAFPSRFEGFGLPVVEAISVGCPVVAADIEVLREVLDGAGTLVDPDDVDGWVAALGHALPAPPEHRRAARDAGARLAARYSPAATALALTDVYGVAAGW